MNKVLLLILDGWGINGDAKVDAITAAKTPFYDSLISKYPNTKLQASGVYVGLPDGIMGNSEVGHENIGAGRINKQKLTMISDMVRSGEFFENQILKDAVEHARKNNSTLHLMGLISEGDVHSHLGHLDGLIELAAKNNLPADQLTLHAISDGRDDPPRVAKKLMQRFENKVHISSVCGRYWAMDRDNNWDRIQRFVDAVIKGEALKSTSASQAIDDAYALAERGENPTGDTDEFVLPTLIGDDAKLISENDSVIFFNFRPDRAREISQKLGVDLGIKNLLYTCFTDYSDELALPVAFSEESLPKQNMQNGLGAYLASKGIKQFRIAETEKFNHVTSFFNMRVKKAYEGEERCLIPSPKVATYDLQPEMSAPEVAEKLIEAINSEEYPLIVCNFANPDMVGHTGVWDAVISALETIDSLVQKVLTAAADKSYVSLVTADHGNADQMYEADGGTRTAHSTNPVPLILVDDSGKFKLKEFKADPDDLQNSTTLANISPTILHLMGIEKPSDMTSDSLLLPVHAIK